jgi:hypothetical protein
MPPALGQNLPAPLVSPTRPEHSPHPAQVCDAVSFRERRLLVTPDPGILAVGFAGAMTLKAD